MSLQENIKEQLKNAMRQKNMERLNILRLISSAFTNEMVSEARIATGRKSNDLLSDEEAIKILKKEAKKRKDSIEQYIIANRPELAEVENFELKVIEEFLPTQMSREEIFAKVSTKISESIIDPTKKGQFIGLMMKELGSNADGTLVKKIIDEIIK